MPTLTYSLSVPFPAEDVFAFVADAENNPRWHEHVNETHWIDERDMGIGRRARQTGRLWGRDWNVEASVVEWDPPRLVTFETSKGVRARTSIRVTPDGDGTRLSLTVTTGPHLGPLDRPISRLMQRATAARGRGDRERLCAALEADRRAVAG